MSVTFVITWAHTKQLDKLLLDELKQWNECCMFKKHRCGLMNSFVKEFPLFGWLNFIYFFRFQLFLVYTLVLRCIYAKNPYCSQMNFLILTNCRQWKKNAKIELKRHRRICSKLWCAHNYICISYVTFLVMWLYKSAIFVLNITFWKFLLVPSFLGT